MSFSNTDYPYRTVVYITDMIGGVRYQASGVMISPDEVLTASHVVWSYPGSAASTITVTPAYNAGFAPYGSVDAAWFHYFQIPNASDLISETSSQTDYAVIHLSQPLNIGYMGYESNFAGGSVHVTGYPAAWSGEMVDTTETVNKDPTYSLLDGVDTGTGSSGSPLWINTSAGPYVVGIVSSGNGTSGYSVQITTSVFNQIETWVLQDDNTNPLVSPLWYDTQYPDVAAAPITPARHYETYGWHEGRNPDPYFSTNGYLAANQDVKAAGIDPLTHYDQYGWKEGRDTAANFDTRLYLINNPDVAKAGMDPLLHYLEYGQSEGRATYAAIGRAANIAADGGFDAEFYLLANPDVAKAALGTSDPMSFAYYHYETYGWHEGRDPNAWFDVSGYLNAYTDVKLAGVEPLQHYDLFGWHEGRDPSASFDTQNYEQANADVHAAGINPLLHFLEYGVFEGRSPSGNGQFKNL